MIERFLKEKLGATNLATLEQIVTRNFVFMLHRMEPGLWEVYNFQGRVNIDVHVDEDFVDILLDDKHIGNLTLFKDLQSAQSFVSKNMVEPEGLALLMQYQLQQDKHANPNFEEALTDHIHSVCSIVGVEVEKEQLQLRVKSAKKLHVIDHQVQELKERVDETVEREKLKNEQCAESGSMDCDITVCTNGHIKTEDGD